MTQNKLPEVVEARLIEALSRIEYGRVSLTINQGQVTAIYSEEQRRLMPKDTGLMDRAGES